MATVKKPIAAITRGRKRGTDTEFPIATLLSAMPTGYATLIGDLKLRIQQSRLRAAVTVNQELLLLYYAMGHDLERRLQEEAWGSGIIDRLSADLRAAFPEMDGLSSRNLRRMRAFYRAYHSDTATIRPRTVAKLPPPKWPRAVAKLSWAHNVILMEKIKDTKARHWYAAAALENGWSRDVLALQIDNGAHRRHGKAISNYRATLPPPQSDLAQQITRDPYQFGFLSLTQPFNERGMERQLVTHVRELLLEPGPSKVASVG